MTLTEMWRWGCLCVVGSGIRLSCDWVILWMGYPVDWVILVMGYPTGDGITILIGKIGSSGG